jgi:hypothetical protein
MNRLMSAQDQVNLIIFDILHHLQQFGGGGTSIPIQTVIEIYIASDEYRFGNKIIYKLFKNLQPFLDYYEEEEIDEFTDIEFSEMFEDILVIKNLKEYKKLFRKVDAREKTYNADRIKRVNDITLLITEMFENEIKRHDLLKGFELEYDDDDCKMLEIPSTADCHPEFLLHQSKLVHKSLFKTTNKVISAAAQNTRMLRRNEKLTAIKSKNFSSNIFTGYSQKELLRLIRKANKISESDLDKMLLCVNKSKSKEGMILFFLKAGRRPQNMYARR